MMVLSNISTTRGLKDKNQYNVKETYAPVSTLSFIRVSIAATNKENQHMWEMDVKTAFLYGELEEEVFMESAKRLDVSEEVK